MRTWLYALCLLLPILYCIPLPDLASIAPISFHQVKESLYRGGGSASETTNGNGLPPDITCEKFDKERAVPTTNNTISGLGGTIRHRQERLKLNERLAKSHGKWNAHHPRRRLLDALYGFATYGELQRAEVDRLKTLYTHVYKKQRKLLERTVHYSAKFAHIKQLLYQNQDLCDRIIEASLQYYAINREELEAHMQDLKSQGVKADRVSVSQALKHIVRDWTQPGEHERASTFPCILDTLNGLFPNQDYSLAAKKILLPGAGLGRLGHELARHEGFEITINEWSMYMNVVYRFLETTDASGTESLRPFIDSWSHHATTDNMHREVSFPDVSINASSVLLVEGDFTEVFHDSTAMYDIVITYFFIDTARNLISYFDTIKRVLKPGGYWLNLGPLLYGTGPFVQLSLEEIIMVVKEMGFDFVASDDSCGELTLPGHQVRSQEAIYGFDDRALTRNAYNAQFWIARRSL